MTDWINCVLCNNRFAAFMNACPKCGTIVDVTKENDINNNGNYDANKLRNDNVRANNDKTNNNYAAYAWLEKGNSLSQLQLYEEAIRCYDEYLKVYSDDVIVLTSRGVCLDWIGFKFNQPDKYNEAIEYYNKAIAIEPNYYNAWYNKGLCLHKLQRYNEAIEAYDKAIEINPDSPAVWVEKGKSLSWLGKYNGSIACYDKVIELDGNSEIGDRDSSLHYYCVNCGTKHNNVKCPKCSSKIKKLGY